MEFYYVRDPYVDIHRPSEPIMTTTEYRHVDSLGERTKELKCLYRVSKTLGDVDSSVDTIMRKVVDSVPSGLQFPEITSARIYIEGTVYLSRRFMQSEWIISENITVNKKDAGTIDVLYAEKRPEFFKGPFLEDEVFLLEAIANMIGHAIERKAIEEEKVKLLRDIQNNYEKILRGIIPICASCKSIRDEKGEWHQLEEYVQTRTEAEFSHSVCPTCIKKLYPNLEM
jgi:hypothetical protein